MNAFSALTAGDARSRKNAGCPGCGSTALPIAAKPAAELSDAELRLLCKYWTLPEAYQTEESADVRVLVGFQRRERNLPVEHSREQKKLVTVL